MKILYEERGLYENIIDGVLCFGCDRQEGLTLIYSQKTVGGGNPVQRVPRTKIISRRLGTSSKISPLIDGPDARFHFLPFQRNYRNIKKKKLEDYQYFKNRFYS